MHLRRIFLIFPFLCLLMPDETVFIRILFIMLVPDIAVRNGLNTFFGLMGNPPSKKRAMITAKRGFPITLSHLADAARLLWQEEDEEVAFRPRRDRHRKGKERCHKSM